MLRYLIIFMLTTISLTSIASSQTDEENRTRAEAEVEGAIKPSSNYRVIDKLTRGNCGMLASGGIAAYLLGAPPELIAWALTAKENELAREAVEYACHRRPFDANTNDKIAVRLLQIAQCHNTSAVDFIEHNQNHVRDALGRRGGCR